MATRVNMVLRGVEHLIVRPDLDRQIIPCVLSVTESSISEQNVMLGSHAQAMVVLSFQTQIGRIDFLYEPSEWRSLAEGVAGSLETLAIMEMTQ